MMNDDIKYIRLQETDSTNRFLHDYREDGNEKIIVVTADYQTAGKGQGSNSWESEQGKNLVFSILFYPYNVVANQQFVISMAISLAIKDALNDYLDDVSIKWPNDIYYRDKKICGILIENSLSGSKIKKSILGIGINVNQQKFMSDAPNPVSIYQIIKKQTDISNLLTSIMQKFSDVVSMLEQKEFNSIRECYRNALYRRTGFYRYADTDGTFMAEIEKVEDDGHLFLKDSDNRMRKYAFKEVTFII
jgi:BirA family biotin operon repressor/biotin-[acetyl-CoA-carboxylase] ligase